MLTTIYLLFTLFGQVAEHKFPAFAVSTAKTATLSVIQVAKDTQLLPFRYSVFLHFVHLCYVKVSVQ